MNTTISLAVTSAESRHAKRMARLRGFHTLSEYLRNLILTDDEAWVLTERELLRRNREVDGMERSGKLLKAKSLKDLLV